MICPTGSDAPCLCSPAMTVTLCLIDSLLSSDLLGSLPTVVIILTSTSTGNNAAKACCAVHSFAGSAINRLVPRKIGASKIFITGATAFTVSFLF